MRAALVEGTWVDGDVELDGTRIAAIGVGASERRGRGVAVPGFVDLQVNGFAGERFATADRDGFRRAARAMAARGTTSFCPTIPTADPAWYGPALATAAGSRRDAKDEAGAYGARPIGVHLEGPFLAPARAGAHPPQHLRAPDLALLEQLCDGGPVTIVTLAPELPGADELIAALVRRGITVAAGHSDADARQARAAFDGGVHMVTHLWNAQRPITARAPALSGAALADQRVWVGVIADGVHLDPVILTLSVTAAAGRAFAVTDAGWAAGLADGEHRQSDGSRVLVADGAVRLSDGSLCGGAHGLDHAVRTMVGAGLALETALGAVTAAPAQAIGRPDLGALNVGGRADVVVLDEALLVDATYVAGHRH